MEEDGQKYEPYKSVANPRAYEAKKDLSQNAFGMGVVEKRTMLELCQNCQIDNWRTAQ